MSKDTANVDEHITIAQIPDTAIVVSDTLVQANETIIHHPNRVDELAKIAAAIEPFQATVSILPQDTPTEDHSADLIIIAKDSTMVRTAALHALIASEPEKRWQVFGSSPSGDKWAIHVRVTPFPEE